MKTPPFTNVRLNGLRIAASAGTSLLLLFAAANAYASTVSVTTVEPSTTVTVGTPVTFAVVATGFNGPIYSLTDSFVEGSLGNPDLNSEGEFFWTPAPNDVGSHSVTINVSDSSGDSGSINVTLDVVSAGSTVTTTVVPVTTPVTTTTVATPEAAFTEDMELGTTDSQVTALQQLLTAEGDFTGPVTGYYGSLTEAAVMKFQAAHNIDQLGIVGPATLAALNAIISTTNTTPVTTTVTTPTTTSTPTLTEIQSEIQSISSSLSQVESQLSQLVGQ